MHAFKGLGCRTPVFLAHAEVTKTYSFNGSKTWCPAVLEEEGTAGDCPFISLVYILLKIETIPDQMHALLLFSMLLSENVHAREGLAHALVTNQ